MELAQERIAVVDACADAPDGLEVPTLVGGLKLHLGGSTGTDLQYIIRIALIAYQFLVEIVAVQALTQAIAATAHAVVHLAGIIAVGHVQILIRTEYKAAPFGNIPFLIDIYTGIAVGGCGSTPSCQRTGVAIVGRHIYRTLCVTLADRGFAAKQVGKHSQMLYLIIAVAPVVPSFVVGLSLGILLLQVKHRCFDTYILDCSIFTHTIEQTADFQTWQSSAFHVHAVDDVTLTVERTIKPQLRVCHIAIRLSANRTPRHSIGSLAPLLPACGVVEENVVVKDDGLSREVTRFFSGRSILPYTILQIGKAAQLGCRLDMIGRGTLVAERRNVVVEAHVVEPAGIECYILFHEVLSKLEECCQSLVLIPSAEEVILLRGAYGWLNGRTSHGLHANHLGTAIAVECDGIAGIIVGCRADHGIVTLAPLPEVQLTCLVVLRIPALHGGIQQIHIFLRLQPSGAAYPVLVISIVGDVCLLAVFIDILGIVSALV